MNTGKSGSIGRAKHRQAFGHNPVSRLVKLDLERQVNKAPVERPKEPAFSSVQELFNWRKKR